MSLRPFVSSWNHPGGRVRTVRGYAEGFSVAHFEADGLGELGNRLTGNPRLAGAPEGLIVGDSHVAAQGVRDEETMGAVIERLARAAGRPLNVRQYGWSGANVPTFIAAAGSLLRARSPAWVAVVLNPYNIGVYAVTTTKYWRMEVFPDGSFRLIDAAPPRPTPRLEPLRQWASRSALALALWRRLGLIRDQLRHEENFAALADLEHRDPSLAEEAARVPRAAVLGLKKAYGSRLLIVYAPDLADAPAGAADPAEEQLLRLCAGQSVACLSVRGALVRDQDQHSRLSRGFHNTAPGIGHFNATGHRILGEEIWHYLAGRLPSPD